MAQSTKTEIRKSAVSPKNSACYHCGDKLPAKPLIFQEHSFCCSGCKTVYQILSDNGLETFYSLNGDLKGNRPEGQNYIYDVLEEETVLSHFLLYQDDQLTKLRFILPGIHCTACIWLLENLQQLNSGIRNSHVNFPKKEITITFAHQELSAKDLALLLHSLGYPPDLHLDNSGSEKDSQQSINKDLLIRIGVAGFCFGNIMLLSFPEYLGASSLEQQYARLFSYLNLLLSFPVLFYSGWPYLNSAFKSIRSKQLNLDVPIALGMLAIFSRSAYEILSATGVGFMDSLAGFVFFLLLGRWFQDRTYQHLSFERNYKSFLPLAILKKDNDHFSPTRIESIEAGDELRIRFGEVIPVDGVLLSERANIDYSFVTGESQAKAVSKGSRLFAGGKVAGAMIEMQSGSSVSASRLAQLWEESESKKELDQGFQFTDYIAKYFTVAVIAIAISAGIFWWASADLSKAALVFTSVLIVACPCALALSAPFTFGNLIRRLARHNIYFKNAKSAERLSQVDSLVFDKTGTLTSQENSRIQHRGEALSPEDEELIKSLTANSLHPLSRAIYKELEGRDLELSNFDEQPGKGISGVINGSKVELGSLSFIAKDLPEGYETESGSEVHIRINERYLGYFHIQNEYREGVLDVISNLKKEFPVHILSGDSDREQGFLESELGADVPMRFRQLPQDKKDFVEGLEAKGSNVAMFGDGLNDAGALLSTSVGVSVVDQVNTFTPASDVIMKGSQLSLLDNLLTYARDSRFILRASLILSLLYNVIGLGFALMGILTPLVAAILMPLSSISVVIFVTLLSNFFGLKRSL